jgi:hypothetical protein
MRHEKDSNAGASFDGGIKAIGNKEFQQPPETGQGKEIEAPESLQNGIEHCQNLVWPLLDFWSTVQ